MKIILAGATGFVGHDILKECIKHHYITHIYAISRTPLDPVLAKHPKVTAIEHEDFEFWPGEQLEELAENGVGACIWCVGGAISQFQDHAAAEHANVALPLAAVSAFAAFLAPQPSSAAPPKGQKRKPPFRFIYLSIAGAEQDASRSLWTNAANRHLKGAAEKALLAFADSEANGMFEVYALRLGRVLAGGQTAANILTESVTWSVTSELAGICAIRTLLDGRTERIVENKEVLGDDWMQVNAVTGAVRF